MTAAAAKWPTEPNELLLNCWQLNQCGREPDGCEVLSYGACPVASARRFDGINDGAAAGRACWMIHDNCRMIQEFEARGEPVLNPCRHCGFVERVYAEQGPGRFVLAVPHVLAIARAAALADLVPPGRTIVLRYEPGAGVGNGDSLAAAARDFVERHDGQRLAIVHDARLLRRVDEGYRRTIRELDDEISGRVAVVAAVFAHPLARTMARAVDLWSRRHWAFFSRMGEAETYLRAQGYPANLTVAADGGES